MAALVATGFALCYLVNPSATAGPLQDLSWLWMEACAIAYLEWAGHRRLHDVLAVQFWVVIVAVLSGPLVRVAGSSGFPLIDERLAQLDFLSTATVVRWFQAHPAAFLVSSVAYWSELPLLVGVMVLPALLGHREAAYRFVVAGILGVFMTALVFAYLPAAGPWIKENYRPTPEQAETSTQLIALKAHQVAGALKTNAIVSFPSFHTILALLCAFALWPIRHLRWPAATLAAAICVSTVTTGWHYGVDVAAGGLVALGAYLLAGLILPRETKAISHQPPSTARFSFGRG
jgi:membrane-associated phospholipid phosphatase